MTMAHDGVPGGPAHDHDARLREVLSARAVILVEGMSDRLALEALARRRERDLASEGVVVLAVGGSKGIAHFLHLLGPRGAGIRVAGLCDAAEVGDFARGLERAGFGTTLNRDDMEHLGFHTCVADLEDELIRSLGTGAVQDVIADRGELNAFRIFMQQPAWHARPLAEQLRRFLGTRGGRKIACAPLLVGALDLARVPRPLDAVLAHV